jgi:hypothetical protein
LAFAPQTYAVSATTASGDVPVGAVVHHKNPFIVKMSLDTSAAPAAVDPRIAVSATALLSSIDASKE